VHAVAKVGWLFGIVGWSIDRSCDDFNFPTGFAASNQPIQTLLPSLLLLLFRQI